MTCPLLAVQGIGPVRLVLPAHPAPEWTDWVLAASGALLLLTALAASAWPVFRGALRPRTPAERAFRALARLRGLGDREAGAIRTLGAATGIDPIAIVATERGLAAAISRAGPPGGAGAALRGAVRKLGGVS